MSDQKFEPGDVVYLKSGSVPMTVRDVHGSEYTCIYFFNIPGATGEYDPFCSEEFEEVLLTKGKPYFA